MLGLNEFISLFGNFTIKNLAYLILSCVFLFLIYKQVKKFFNNKFQMEEKKQKKEEERDKDLKLCLDQIKKYPEYRQQSINIQQELKKEIQEIKDTQKEYKEHLDLLEENIRRRERKKLYEKLIQNYNLYANKEKNPLLAWSEMESIGFWDLFDEYEDAGGNGFLHSTVQPAMKMLTVIKMDDIESITKLMQSRK